MARKPTYSQVPGDGRPRLTQRTEITQSFEGTKAQVDLVAGNATGLVQPVAPPVPTAGTGGGGRVTVQMPGGLLTNGIAGAVAGSSFQITIGVSGLLKGVSGALVAAVAGTDFEAALGNPSTDGYVLSSTAAGVRSWVAPSGGGGGGSGTVTSVSLAAPSFLSVSGSPVTSSGTLTLSLANQNANLVFAGPTSGGAAAPTFRSLVNADLPASGVSAGTYGDASNVAQVTVNSKGIVTAISSVPISGGGGGYPPWVAPPVSGWSWVNQGSSTAANGTALDGADYVAIRVPGSNSFAGGRFYLRALPAAPYSITCVLQAFTLYASNFEWGVALRQSGSGIITFGIRSYGYTDQRVNRQGYSSAGTGTSGGASNALSLGAVGGGMMYGTLFYFKLSDDGTNRKFWISSDGGEWYEAFSESNTLTITPSEFGIYVTPWSSANINMNESIVTIKHLGGI